MSFNDNEKIKSKVTIFGLCYLLFYKENQLKQPRQMIKDETLE